MMVIVVLVVGPVPDIRILALPLILLVGVAMVAGCVFVIARVGKHFPDLHSAATASCKARLLLLGCAVCPDVVHVEPDRANAVQGESLFDLLEMLRWSLMGRPIDTEVWFIAAGWAVVLLLGGFCFFWREELSYGNS